MKIEYVDSSIDVHRCQHIDRMHQLDPSIISEINGEDAENDGDFDEPEDDDKNEDP